MQLAQFAKSYKSVAISTASPGRLILMLFDGALRFMAEAEVAFNEADFVKRNETVHNKLLKTQSILRELQCSLDKEVDPEFADRMYALYGFMISQLQQANLKKDPAPIRVVAQMLGDIRDAWAKMLEQATTQVA